LSHKNLGSESYVIITSISADYRQDRNSAGLGETNKKWKNIQFIITILLLFYPNPLPDKHLRPIHYIVIATPWE
jgi:hypothetical protein